ncbi:MAG: L-lysine 6-transaminase [Armatimonadota bacterium]
MLTKEKIQPKDVVKVISKHMLADGYTDIVVDLERSEGSYIYDSLNNRKLLDFFSFFATYPIGYNHPKLKTPEFTKKLFKAAEIKPSNSDFYTIEMAEFVQTFYKICAPEELPHLFLIDGGGLAVENALKVAFDWKVRKNLERGIVGKGDEEKEKYGTRVIHFKESFHGRTGYTMSMTNTADPRKYMYFAKFDWPRFPNPKLRFPVTEDELKRVEKEEKDSILMIENYLKMYPHSCCAIVIEPIQGEGGDNHFRPEFFKELRRLADEHELLLVFDEVQTGIGLTGKMWAHEYYGVLPDILCFGKKTQVCGICVSDRVSEVKDNCFELKSRLNSSWGGNLVDMIRATKMFEIIQEDNLVKNARVMGEKFIKGLYDLQKKYPDKVSNVRGKGLFTAFDLPTTQMRDKYLTKLRNNNFIGLASGHTGIRFRPHLDVDENIINEALQVLEKTLKEI